MIRQYRRWLPVLRRHYSAMSSSSTPMEDIIRAKITSALVPSRLELYNDSQQHAHHKAMVGSPSRETHFRLVITSAAFQGKRLPARHRIVYALLKDDMSREGGIHSLQLRTLTPDEDQPAPEEAQQEPKEAQQESAAEQSASSVRLADER